jgi:flagellar brake protein
MTTDQDLAPVSVFEIDQAENRRRYLVTHTREIVRNLAMLQEKNRFISVYLESGENFFLSTIITIDEAAGVVFLDPPGTPELRAPALAAGKITFSGILDRIKIQFRADALIAGDHDDRPALIAAIPKEMLRLQRREFFRIDTPLATPLRCQLIRHREEEQILVAELILRDISGGGMCLSGPIELAEKFAPGELFSECRLEIPGDSVFAVNLRIREISRFETATGDWQLRLGCEFINLPGTRLSLIERYVTRLERERKSRESGML